MTTESKQKIFDKLNPTAGNTKHFIPLPSDARHYIHHDKMSADKFYLYQLIIDHYNPTPEYGYAFPSIERLSVQYGKTPDTTSRHLDDLKEVGLIDFPEKGFYLPLIPLPEDEFYEKFPKAYENYRESLRKSDTRRSAAAERMRAWRAERGYTD